MTNNLKNRPQRIARDDDIDSYPLMEEWFESFEKKIRSLMFPNPKTRFQRQWNKYSREILGE